MIAFRSVDVCFFGCESIKEKGRRKKEESNFYCGSQWAFLASIALCKPRVAFLVFGWSSPKVVRNKSNVC